MVRNGLFLFTGLALIASLGACSTAMVRVLPGPNGLHTVHSADIERDGAEEAAIDAAKEYCEERKRVAVFESHKSKYRGAMDEATRNTIRGASKAVSMLGNFDSPVRQAGHVGVGMTNDRDYESNVTFRCK